MSGLIPWCQNFIKTDTAKCLGVIVAASCIWEAMARRNDWPYKPSNFLISVSDMFIDKDLLFY